jgi:hypothetical protein
MEQADIPIDINQENEGDEEDTEGDQTYIGKKDISQMEEQKITMYDGELKLDQKVIKSYDLLLEELKCLMTCNFNNTLSRVKDVFRDVSSPNIIIFILASWLFRKIHIYYKPTKVDHSLYLEHLLPRINNEQNPVIKGTYLKYHNYLMLKDLTEHFYFNRFASEFFIIQMLNDVELIQSVKLSEGMREHFIEWIRKASTYSQQCNLLDVLLRYYRQDPVVIAIRNKMEHGSPPLEKEESHVPPMLEKKQIANLYTNNQNAHDEDITDETLLAFNRLFKWYHKHPFISEEERQLYSFGEYEKMVEAIKHLTNASEVIERAKIDTTVFQTSDYRFIIMDALIALVRLIDLSPHKSSLLKRLEEEFADMTGLCPSGYINRFINTLQGYHEEYSIKIPFSKQLQAILSYKLGLAIQTASDFEIEGSYDQEHKHLYLAMVEKVINKEIPMLRHTYGENDVDSSIEKVVTNFINHPCHYAGGIIKFDTSKGIN